MESPHIIYIQNEWLAIFQTFSYKPSSHNASPLKLTSSSSKFFPSNFCAIWCIECGHNNCLCIERMKVTWPCIITYTCTYNHLEWLSTMSVNISPEMGLHNPHRFLTMWNVATPIGVTEQLMASPCYTGMECMISPSALCHEGFA